MKHSSTGIVVIGLLLVGMMVGLAISEIDTPYTSIISTISSLIQACTSGLTLFVAYWAYRSWQRQLLYPRYLDAMSQLYDEFYKIVENTRQILYMPNEDLQAFVENDLEFLYADYSSHLTLMTKNELLIKRFALDDTVEIMMWFNVSDKHSYYRGRIYYAKVDGEPHKAHSEYIELLRYCEKYRVLHNASLP
ncbi:hypothetical protein ACK345_02790 [Aeromonas rivipollensis]|uniref:Uncharacterized protein n=1 Tax=Aeromonas rivipollensis TaxID=948519 RepID=A0AAW9YGL8_9GAMM|nr:hypothetical protein [Aeromonas rivipollensis]NEX76582.1 hypothetical protein [Aeromonas rivipollensis]